MPKLSVSIPDDLWDRARQAHADLNPSHTVQLALSRLVESALPPYAPPAHELEAVPELQATRERLTAHARVAFTDGFHKALKGTQTCELTYQDLLWLGRRGWDVELLPDRYQATSNEKLPDDEVEAGEVFGEEYDEDVGSWLSSPAFVEGRNAAFRMLLQPASPAVENSAVPQELRNPANAGEQGGDDD